jgi:hypothetical protein
MNRRAMKAVLRRSAKPADLSRRAEIARKRARYAKDFGGLRIPSGSIPDSDAHTVLTIALEPR